MTLVLDAGCGNRAMWLVKTLPQFVYLDKEKHLKRKPTIISDLTRAPFLDKTFDVIFFDPPHISRKGSLSSIHANPQFRTFYGWDISKSGITKLIFEANIEFNRILKDEGLLFLKWNEYEKPLWIVLDILSNFQPIMKNPIKSRYQQSRVKNPAQTWWIVLVKKKLAPKRVSAKPTQCFSHHPKPDEFSFLSPQLLKRWLRHAEKPNKTRGEVKVRFPCPRCIERDHCGQDRLYVTCWLLYEWQRRNTKGDC